MSPTNGAESRLIYIVRHGDLGLPPHRMHFIGRQDLPLSEIGIGQAVRMGRVLARATLSGIYCSDLGRSRETARIIAESHGLTPIQVSGLREIALGEWDGLAFDEVRTRYPGEFEARGRDIVHFRPPGGESFEDCSRRVVVAFEEILRSQRGDLLIAAHAGVNRILVSHLLGLPLEKIFSIGQDPGSLSVVRMGQSGNSLEKLNCVPEG